MLNFNEIEISVYTGVFDRIGHTSTLAEFLNNPALRPIKELRESKDPNVRRSYKKTLPQATISGTFGRPRSAATLRQHSGLICVDIDGKDNAHWPSWKEAVREFIAEHDYVAYAAVSVSGNGCFMIIPLRYPEQHQSQFLALVDEFAAAGIAIDMACADVCRLRTQSYDPNPYFNPNATPFEGLYVPPKPPESPTTGSQPTAQASLLRDVERACQRLAATHTDITRGYDNWLRVGLALASLGEAGRHYFHICSAQNPEYTPDTTDRLFSDLLRRSRPTNPISLATFFYYCHHPNT